MLTTHPACGKSWGGTRAQHCAACCETFSGTSAGDAHRVGDHNDGTRRCLTVAEMLAAQWPRDERGVWGSLRTERAREYFEARKSRAADDGEASQ